MLTQPLSTPEVPHLISWTTSRAARIGILFLPSLIVLACVGVTVAIAVSVQDRSIRDATAERVRNVATSLAALSQVQDALSGVGPERAGLSGRAEAAHDLDATLRAAQRDLQPLADLVMETSGVDYVVIADVRGVRATHPEPEERGEPLSTDPSDALSGIEYLGTEEGTLGPTLRAKVPVRDEEGRVVGMVSVGILESRIAEDLSDSLRQLMPWALAALVIGTLVSSLVAAALETRFQRLDTAALEADRLRRTAAALREQSHEFNTRMHVIHGLVSHGDTAEAIDYIQTLAPVRTTPSEEGLQGQPLLRATVEALRAELEASGARLIGRFELTADIDDELALLLANLCRNAGEAGASTVQCWLVQEGARVRGTVEDDGPGIETSQAERVFVRGFSSKLDGTGAGRGVGLDLVRRIVLARDGAIELGRSELGGARFGFELDAKP